GSVRGAGMPCRLRSLLHCCCTSASSSSNAPAPTQTSTLSLHDALPISSLDERGDRALNACERGEGIALRPPNHRHRGELEIARRDRKSTRLNSSHVKISYAVFCLKKKKDQVPSHTSRVDKGSAPLTRST